MKRFFVLFIAAGLAACGSNKEEGGSGSSSATLVAQDVPATAGKPCKINADCDDKNDCRKMQCVTPKGKSVGVCTASVDTLGSQVYKTGLCDDGDACTMNDKCVGAVCTGSSLDCDDKNQCTTDSCDSKQGCKHMTIAVACDDSNACTKLDACTNGTCKGVAIDCDDGNPCTSDSCDASKGCVNNPLDGKPCDDSNVCTSGDVCKGGFCQPGAGVNCDDKNVCTSDSCDPKSGCKNTPTAGACDDNNPNTLGDVCDNAGKCKGTPKQCSADSDCKGLEIDQCNAYRCQNGKCVEDWDITKVVDDNNPCTADACDPKSGIITHTPIGGACDDSEVCTKSDSCVAGACKGTLDTCDDSNACTLDYCLPKIGCKHSTNACDDGSVFTADKCVPEANAPDKACLHVEYVFTAYCGIPDKFKDPMYAALGFSCRTVVSYLAKDAAGKWGKFAKSGLVDDAGQVTLPASTLCGAFDATVADTKVTINVELCNTLDGSCVKVGGQWATLVDPIGGNLKAAATTPEDASDWVLSASAIPLCKAAGK